MDTQSFLTRTIILYLFGRRRFDTKEDPKPSKYKGNVERHHEIGEVSRWSGKKLEVIGRCNR